MTDLPLRLHFVRAAGFSSWLIARFGVQKLGFSHVDILLPDGWLLGARDDAIGAISPGVQVRPPDYERWRQEATVTFHRPAAQVTAALAWAMGQRGEKYDEDAILGYIFGQRWHKNGDWICSVLAGTCLLKAGIIRESPANLQGTSPNDLYSICLAEGGSVT